MKISIQVNEGPYQHQSADTAYQFAKAAIEKGHEIFRVFFYHDGVNNASRFTVPPQDDRNVVNNWADLKNADGSDIDRVVCVAAALRRGMLDESEAGKNSVEGNNIHPAFRISGLGQLIEAGIQSDRLVVFGD
ncbi:MAG: sulfurtransferase complex subunit TusD [Gammaproteobacteria bacterium]|jgi:tRNA 2-thiouridine synthesizing protein D|nr:sulfurtransferase complex subunit TusD [Gammaproteobacteria bacterium]NBQ34450.1 sulfurtransferase complex subunit TusD [Gammaproteobacteria bacterium]